jgi:mannosyltransferase
LAVALLVAAGAAAVRAVPAAGYPLWQDEVASARIIIEPTIGAALERVTATESTPPLWYVLAWAVHHAGLPVEASRAIGVAAGAVLAGLVVLYGRRFLPLGAAALAGIATALAGQLVLRGAELRAYSLYALAAFGFAWLLERAAARPTSGRLAALAAVTTAGLLTHYFFAFVLLAGIAWLWGAERRLPRRGRVSAAAGAGIVPFLLWTPWLAEQIDHQRYAWIGDFSLLKTFAVYSSFAWNAGPLYVRELVPIGPWDALVRTVVFALVVAGCAVLWRLGPRGRLAAILALVPVLLSAALWLTGENLFNTRNVIASAPFAALALAAGVARLPGRWAIAAGLAFMTVVVAGLVREADLAPLPYDRLATALVSLGWQDGDRLAVFADPKEPAYLGSIYAFRGPVSWYLPGHPVLRFARGQPCRGAFAIAPGPRPSLEPVEAETTVAGTRVIRIRCRLGIDTRIGRDGGFVFLERG